MEEDLRLIPCPLDLPCLAGEFKGLALALASRKLADTLHDAIK